SAAARRVHGKPRAALARFLRAPDGAEGPKLVLRLEQARMGLARGTGFADRVFREERRRQRVSVRISSAGDVSRRDGGAIATVVDTTAGRHLHTVGMS